MRSLSIITLLVFASLACCQRPPQAPPLVLPPQAPPLLEPEEKSAACKPTCPCKNKGPCTCSGGKCACKTCNCNKRNESDAAFLYYPDLRKQVMTGPLPGALFVGIDPRKVNGVVVGMDDPKEGWGVGVYVMVQGEDGFTYCHCLPASASDADICKWAAVKPASAPERVVQPSAVPFDNRKPSLLSAGDLPAPADANRYATGPWLPQAEQEKVKALWPEGVPFPDTLKFYKLRPASQRVASFNSPGQNNNRRFVVPTVGAENANRDFPWIGSGGMDWAKPGTWRNVTGMALPRGSKIQWWLAQMPLKNSFGNIQMEGAMHWEFPTGTQMFDVLVRKNDDGTEHVFTVRRRVKEAKGWDDGTSYFPDVAVKEHASYKSAGNHRTKNVLGVEEITYRVGLLGKLRPERVKFKESTTQLTDEGHFFPPGFKGTGMTCNKCHNGGAHESKDYGGPLLRGKDTVFSWYPVSEQVVGVAESFTGNADFTPTVDSRWPLEYKR